MKTCNRCKVEKAPTEFHSRKCRGKPGFLDYQCIPCTRIRSRETYARRRAAGYRPKAAYKHGSTIKSKYGITADEYTAMLALQGGACALCGTVPPATARKMCVDHCHETGQVRALLCNPCNGGLGCFRDSEHVLRLAAKYIAHFR